MHNFLILIKRTKSLGTGYQFSRTSKINPLKQLNEKTAGLLDVEISTYTIKRKKGKGEGNLSKSAKQLSRRNPHKKEPDRMELNQLLV